MAGEQSEFSPFDFTGAMSELCDDISCRVDEFLHIDMSRVVVAFAQTRQRTCMACRPSSRPCVSPGEG